MLKPSEPCKDPARTTACGIPAAGAHPAPPVALGRPWWRESLLVRFLLLLAVLLLFFLSINLLGSALKGLAKSSIYEVLAQGTSNPVVGLLLGIVLTSIIQSSSTTTSITVTFAAMDVIPLRAAIPIVMGANIGTTVTSVLVSFTLMRRRREFERALSAGVVHDWFNVLATLVLFPLELLTHTIERSALFLKGAVIGTSVGEVGGLKDVIKPAVRWFSSGLGSGWLLLLVALVLLILSLGLMVKIMRSIFLEKMAKILDRYLFRNAMTAFGVGVVFTIFVQSSSVTTSLIVPLVGAGILTLEQIFPYTLGANIGTTVTAFLAAMAIASGGDAASATAGVGLTVAVSHLLFNVFGILIIYPIRRIPIGLARWLARTMTHSRKRAVTFLLLYFLAYAVPFALILIF